MRFQDVFVLKILVAQVTLKRPLVVVYLLVNGKVGKLFKHFRADLTLIRAPVFVSGANMTAQSIGQRVTFTTDFTAKRSFIRVRQKMTVQIPFLQKSCTAHVALVRFLTVVHVHMLLERV